MTKKYFLDLAGYNMWATNIFCNMLEEITDEQWTQNIISSFNSIQETTLHIISAEKAWVERFQKKVPEWLQFSFKGSKEEHITIWKQTSAGLKDFVEAFDEKSLQTNLDYKRLNGDAYSTPFYVLFAHAVNHSTYHRGQLITMLRQAGFTGVKATDLIGFFRTN